MENDEDLQCPVCFEIPQNQIYQCLNGHTVCGKCCANMTNCPQCRVDLKVNGELIRNRVAESLIARNKASSLTLAAQGPSKKKPQENTNNGLSLSAVVWECPVCHKIPQEQIYQCPNGHCICHVCIRKVQICPRCRATFGRVRNQLAETLLDSMTFPCPWKDQGCFELCQRRQLFEHESICDFRTIKFCSLFAGFSQCQFQTTRWLLQDAEEFKRALQHLQTHNLIVTTGIPIGFPYNFSVYQDHFALGGNRIVHYMKPQFLEIVSSLQQTETMPSNKLAILLQKIELDKKGQKIFSLGFVLFKSQSVETDCQFTVKMSIKGQPKPEIAAKFGTGCVPDLNWVLKPMNDTQYMEFLRKPDLERPSFGFTLPVSHVQKFYVDINGCFTFSFTFQRE